MTAVHAFDVRVLAGPDGFVPAGAVWAETDGDLAGAAGRLGPEERAHAARLGAARRAEFASARGCAHRALTALGAPPGPVGRGLQGEPRWPGGVVGSITHCTGLRAALLARTASWTALGIDAEPDLPLPDGVAPYALLPDEQRRLEQRPLAGVHADRLVFCVKEAVFKCCAPATELRPALHDVDVTLHADGRVDAVLLGPPAVFRGSAVRRLTGRWTSRGRVLRTWVGVPARV